MAGVVNVKDVQKVLNDVRSRIDQVSAFLPPRTEDPECRQIVFRAPAIQVGILGPKGIDKDDLRNQLQFLYMYVDESENEQVLIKL